MTIFKEFQLGGDPQGGGRSPFGGIAGLISLAVFMMASFFLFKGLFWMLSLVAPVLLITTLILDYTVVTDFVKFLMKSLKDNPLFGIMAIVLSLAAYPFTTGFLFFRAMMRRVIMKVHQPKEEIFADGENVNDEGFSDYEEVETPERPEVKIKKAKGKDNDHDQMFD
ncbi:MAG TPA: hypothetical protein DCW93_01150 [Saprospirales bacterium]|nr:hypothetical protein [Saprospirales bacterium]